MRPEVPAFVPVAAPVAAGLAVTVVVGAVPVDIGPSESVGHVMEVDCLLDNGQQLARGGTEVVNEANTVGAVDTVMAETLGGVALCEAYGAGVLSVLRRLCLEPGGEQAVWDVTAWVAARRALRPSAPSLSTSARAKAVALAESDPPAEALVRSILKRLRLEPGGTEVATDFVAWVG